MGPCPRATPWLLTPCSASITSPARQATARAPRRFSASTTMRRRRTRSRTPTSSRRSNSRPRDRPRWSSWAPRAHPTPRLCGRPSRPSTCRIGSWWRPTRRRPRRCRRRERELEDRLAAEATLEFVLEGDGGGAWFVNVHGEDVRVERAPARPPLIRLSQSRADWEALARSGLGMGAPPGAGDLTRARITRLATLKGTLEFRLITDDGERRVLVQFGPADAAGPRCAVTLRADDARRLQGGQLA